MTVFSSAPFMTPALIRQSQALRADLQRASTEMTTGVVSDTGNALGGDFSALSGIDQALSRIAGYAATNSETALMASAMQSALNVITDRSETLSSNLLGTVGVATAPQLAAMVPEGSDAFAAAVAALNTRISERGIFAGVQSDAVPLPDADALLSALETALGGVTTAGDAQTAITDWFMGPAGYETLYSGGAARSGVPIAPGESVALTTTALDPALRETLSQLAMVALVDRGLLAGDHAARIELVSAAGTGLAASGEARALLASRIGRVQEQVADAQTRNSAEETALNLARIGLTEADPYETSTLLQDLEARLESFYVITARLSKLSLTEYL